MTATTMVNNHKHSTNNKIITATITTIQTKHNNNADDPGMMVLEHVSK